MSTKVIFLLCYWEYMPHQPALKEIVLCNGQTGLESRWSVFDKYLPCEFSVVLLFTIKILQMLSNSLY